MKGRSIDQLVYECMFPKPKPVDPQSFHDLLRRHLIPEVRSETVRFYGSLNTPEARYPGLNYSYQPHRMRLSQFTWHQRLFYAFDTLKLTPSEIAGLAKWEGTGWAREKHEQNTGVKIRDTTGDCIYDWVDPELRVKEDKMGVTKEWGSLMDGVEAYSTPSVASSNIPGQTSTTPIPQYQIPEFLQDILGPNIDSLSEHRDTPVPVQGGTASVRWYF